MHQFFISINHTDYIWINKAFGGLCQSPIQQNVPWPSSSDGSSGLQAIACRSVLQSVLSSFERYVVISSSHRPHTYLLPLILNFILFYVYRVIVSDTKAMDALGSPTPQEGKRFRNMPYSSSNETLRSYTSFGVKLSETGKRGVPRGASGSLQKLYLCACTDRARKRNIHPS